MNFLKDILNYENGKRIIGLTNELNVFFVLETFKKSNRNVIVLTSSLYEANKLYSSLKNYEENTLLFPMDDFLTSVALAISPELKITRLDTLEKIKSGKNIIVTNLMGFLRFLPDKNASKKLELKLDISGKIARNKILDVLENFGYIRESTVTSTGEYAVRGFIIDVFPVHMDHPIRIEFFGDEIESIRNFDENTQLSTNELNSFVLLPYQEIETDNNSSLYEYADDPIVFFIDESQINANYQNLQKEMFEYRVQEELEQTKKFMFNLEDIKINDVMYINTFNDGNFDKRNSLIFNSKEIENFNSNFDKLKESYMLWKKQNKKIIFCLSKDKQINYLKKLLGDKINVVKKKINKGFIIDNYVVISEYDIENVVNSEIKYRNSYRIGQKIKDFDQLKIGDYVIHSIHGIGIYKGIITLSKNGLKKDYIQIDYYGNDKIYIPV